MSKLLSRKVLVPAAIIIGILIVLYALHIPKIVPPFISIAAETVFKIGPVEITNTMLATWLTMIVLIVAAWTATRKLQTIPGRWQSLWEMIVEGLYGLVEGAAGPKWAPKFFPLVTSIFLFVVLSNWLGLTPLFGAWGVLHPAHGEEGHPVQWLNDSETIGLWVRESDVQADTGHSTQGTQAQTSETQESHDEHPERYELAPMFRAATTDLNVTLALAVVSVLMTQYFGVKALGIGYFGKFIAVGGIVKAFTKKGLGCGGRIGAFGMGIVNLFIGMVETISEIGKIISFSFRLFGNIFAGEVLLVVVAFVIPYLVSLPFYGLELFVGLVQALVFMILTISFFLVAISSHGEEGH